MFEILNFRLNKKVFLKAFTCYKLIKVNCCNKKNLIKKPWNILFFGTDNFSLESLKILENEYRSKSIINNLEVVSLNNEKYPVNSFAINKGLKLHKWPIDFAINDYDIGIVVSFGHLIPSWIINSFPLGMINVHASLLPKWRGAAPIIHSLINGDTQTGVTVITIKPKKFDIGEILIQKKVKIAPDDTQIILHKKLSIIGAELLLDVVKQLPHILVDGKSQDESSVTYAPKITRKISLVNWNKMTAKNVYDLQRALDGIYPLTSKFSGEIIKIFNVKLYRSNHIDEFNSSQCIPGLLMYSKSNNLLLIQCSDGKLVSIDEISIPRRRKMTSKDFYNGFMSKKINKIILESPDDNEFK